MAFSAGTQVGPYRIMEQLGQGGMATVYKAYHASLDRYVAIKVLHLAFMEDASFHARFQREARVVAKLEHPNIVPIYDYAEHEGQPYLVMKYIEGDTLKARIQQGPLTAAEVEHIVVSVGAALSYAHRQGILHRDIKPSNVINALDGQIYLADFGLARIAQSGESTLTSDMVLGTPQYISPEQAMAKKDLDEGTDIYSFGVMLYEMTVGRVPFSADTPFSVIHDHIYTPLPLPSSVNPAISPALERVLLKALAKDRADRYKDVAAMVEAFKDAWKAKSSTATMPSAPPVSKPTVVATPSAAPVAPQPVTPPPAAPQYPQYPPSYRSTAGIAGASSVARPQRPPSNRRWWWIAAAVPVFCLCCLVVFLLVRASNNETSFQETPDVEATFEASLPGLQGTLVFAIGTPFSAEETPEGGESVELPNMSSDRAKQQVDQNPKDPGAHLFYGYSLIIEGQEQAGYDQVKQGVDLADKNQPLLIGAANAFEEQDLWLAAAIVYMQIAQNAHAMPAARQAAMRRAIYLGFQESDAPAVLDYGTIGQVDQALALIAQARYDIESGTNEDEAQTLINQLEALQPGLAETKLLQAQLWIDRGHASDAKTLLQRLIAAPGIPAWIEEEAGYILSEIP
jgi:serine/threonine protein kinase